jgi:hypothetical protein
VADLFAVCLAVLACLRLEFGWTVRKTLAGCIELEQFEYRYVSHDLHFVPWLIEHIASTVLARMYLAATANARCDPNT